MSEREHFMDHPAPHEPEAELDEEKVSLMSSSRATPRDTEEVTYTETSSLGDSLERIDAEHLGRLRKVWEAVSVENSPSDPREATDRFVTYFASQYGPDTFLLPTHTGGSNLGAGEEAEFEPIDGTPDEVRMRIAAYSRRLARHTHRLRRFFRETVGSTIERLEKQRIGTLVDHVGLATPVFGFREADAWSDSLKGLLRGLAGCLESASEELRNDEYWRLVAVLGDIATEPRISEADWLGGYYYHRVCAHYYEDVASGKTLSNEGIKRMHIVLHNVASILRRCDARGGKKTAARVVARRLVKGSIALSGAMHEGPAWNDSSRAVFESMVGKAPPEGSSARMVLYACMADSPWLEEHAEAVRAFCHAVLACVACSERALGERAPAAFFNAGVALLRASNAKTSFGRGRTASLRVVLNALGLSHALYISPDIVAAMTVNDGLDCAVNFFGACTDVGWDADGKNNLVGIARHLFRLEGRLGGKADIEFERLRASLQELGLLRKVREGGPESEEDMEALNKRLHLAVRSAVAVVSATLAEVVPKNLDWYGNTTAIAEAGGRVVGALFERIDEAMVQEAAQAVWSALADIARQGQDAERVVLDTYRACMVSRRASGGQVPATEPGPLVVAKVLDLKQWRRLAKAAIDENATRVSEAVKSSTGDWWR